MFLSLFSCRILVFSTLWLANNGFVLKNIPESKPQNHLKNKDDGNLRVDLDINDDDYNWSEYDLTKSLTGQFEEFDRILIENENDKAKDENVYDKSTNVRISNTETGNHYTTEIVATPPSLNSIEKTETTVKLGAAHVKGKRYKVTKENVQTKVEKKTADACDGGMKGIKCLFVDSKEHRQPYFVLAARIWNVALIWLSVYGALAIPFWCIKGWCCCCLCCKFFKPQETIQEAKGYLLLNPPGVLVTKKGAIIHYEPTEREKDCYEEFGHFMRTL